MGAARRATGSVRARTPSRSADQDLRWEQTLTIAASVLIASPVVINPTGFDQFQLPKLVVQSLAVLVGLTSIAVLHGMVWHRAFVPLVCLVGALLSSALVSDAPMVAIVGTSSRRFGVIGWLLMAAAFVIGTTLARLDRRRALFDVLLISSVFVSGYVVAQRLGFDPVAQSDGGPNLRPGATFGSATFCGGYLALVVAIGTARLLNQREHWRWLGPIVGLGLVALLLTQSRGAWIGAALGTTLAAVVAWRRSHDAFAPILLAGGVVITVVTLVTVPGLASRASSLTQPTEGTAGGRIELAQMGLGAVAARPLLGWGPDLSRAPMHAQIASDFEARFSDDRIEDRAHNAVIDVAIWAGLIGLFLLSWFAWEVGRSGWTTRADWTVVAVCAGLLAFGVHLSFNFPVPELEVVVWLLAGTLVPSVGTRTLRMPASMALTAATLFGVAVLVVSLDAFSADLHLRRGVDAENDGDLVEAGDWYTKAVKIAPDSTRMLEVESRWLLRQGQPARAVDVARRAVDADRSDPYMAELLAKSLSAAALATGDTKIASEAETVLRSLLERSPYDGSLHLEIGTALAAQGRTDEAAEAYERAAEILPARSEPVRNLALLAEQRGELGDALALFEQAIELNPADRAALDGRDRVLMEMNQP